MLVTPPPSEVQLVSAILFAPGEGSLLFKMIDTIAYQHPDQPRVISVDCRPHGLYSTPLVEDNFPDIVGLNYSPGG